MADSFRARYLRLSLLLDDAEADVLAHLVLQRDFGLGSGLPAATSMSLKLGTWLHDWGGGQSNCDAEADLSLYY